MPRSADCSAAIAEQDQRQDEPADRDDRQSRCFHWPISRSLRASRSAAHSTSASFASSDGWMRNGPPKSSQFLLPLTSVPATTTSTSSATDATRPRCANSRHALVGRRDANHMSGSPITTHIACLLTIAIDEPMNANATTLDAEKTITTPSTSSSVLAPSSR